MYMVASVSMKTSFYGVALVSSSCWVLLACFLPISSGRYTCFCDSSGNSCYPYSIDAICDGGLISGWNALRGRLPPSHRLILNCALILHQFAACARCIRS